MFIEQYIHETNVSEPTFAANVVAEYTQRISEDLRTINFHVQGDAYKNMRANAQILRRFFNGDTRLPVELEESLIFALPFEWRNNLLCTLSARYGLLPTPIPQQTDCDIENTGQLLEEFGEALQALSPALIDGRIDEADIVHAEKILKEVADVQGLLASVTEKVYSITQNQNNKVVRFKKN